MCTLSMSMFKYGGDDRLTSLQKKEDESCSTMATETSDSINLAYEFALRPQKCIISTFNLKGHMLCCTSVTMN